MPPAGPARALEEEAVPLVPVRAGVVELTGTVEDPAAGRELQELLAHLPGVVRVENQLLAQKLLD